MKLIEVNCYNCGSSKWKLYDKENGYTLVKCDTCGLLFINPRPSDEDISDAIVQGMHKGRETLATTGRYSYLRVRRYLKILKGLYPNDLLKQRDKNWLDIGCGFGEFMESLLKYSDHSLIVKGTDPNQNKINSARKRNLDVSFLDLEKLEEKFNYISLLNVYSHLPNPISFLSNISSLLKNNGELLLETGHSCHLPNTLHHKPYLLPDHLSFANKEIVENILIN